MLCLYSKQIQVAFQNKNFDYVQEINLINFKILEQFKKNFFKKDTFIQLHDQAINIQQSTPWVQKKNLH